MSDLPLIDLSPVWSSTQSPACLQNLLSQIDQALQSTGFLCVTGTPWTAEYVTHVQSVAQHFFDSPQEFKLQHAAIQYKNRGYTGLGEQGLSYASDDDELKQTTAHPPDLFERYRIGPVDRYEHLGEVVKPYLDTAYAPNQWPSNPIEFQSVMEGFYRAMNQLSVELMRLFALALGLDRHWFDPKIDRGMSSLAINHYPSQHAPPLPGQLRAGAHTDFGTLTIVAATPGPGGLQIRDKSTKSWLDIDTTPDAFVVNIGDMMAQWSNDRWVSTVHRVINPPLATGQDNKRLSLVFFHQPNPDALVSCIPTCCNEQQPAKYPDTWAGLYIAEKINRNFRSYRSS
jgi:isopenicillin N synthase-like dioxygenase